MEYNTTTTIATKRCSKCGCEKPITEFHKRKASPDGLQSWCIQCTKECNARYVASKKAIITPPQSVTAVEPHPVFSKMQPREIQNEIRERVNYLRSTGWDCEVKLTYTQVREIII